MMDVTGRMHAHTCLSDADYAGMFAPLDDFDHVLLAVSGGVDSTVLMHAVCAWRNKHLPLRQQAHREALKVSVACVDHGLRAGSEQEARAVEQTAQSLGLGSAILKWQGEKPVTRVQETARSMRYALLGGHARAIGAGALVLAHHADDQAETVLMRLAAGSGPEGLCGMRPRRVREGLVILRPFLLIPKARLIVTAQNHGWHWHEDPSNQLDRYGRVRIRKMQAVRDGVGLTTPRLVRFTQRLARQQEVIDTIVAAEWGQCVVHEGGAFILSADLWRLPAEIRMRLIGQALHSIKGEAAIRLERLEALEEAMFEARSRNEKSRRSLGGCVVDLSLQGRIRISPEPARRRGAVSRD